MANWGDSVNVAVSLSETTLPVAAQNTEIFQWEGVNPEGPIASILRDDGTSESDVTLSAEKETSKGRSGSIGCRRVFGF